MKNLFTILAFWVITIASFSSLAQTPDISVKYGSTNVPNNAGVSNNNGTLFSSIPLSNGTLSSDFTIENRGTGTLTISSIEITGTEAGDFTVGNSPSTTLAPNATTTLRITFNPSVAGRRTATVTITSNDSDESPFRLNFLGFGIEPEMDVFGNGYPIASGSSTPITNNHTHFGAEFVTAGSIVRTFTIENNESAALNLTGTPTKVAITGTHASDFTLTAAPSSPVPRFGSTTFQITFNPSGNGVRTALLTIANDDEDERPYTFAIEGVGTVLSSSADYTISTANNTVTINDVGGNGETIDISESNSTIRFFVSGRTYSIDGGAVTPFTTPADIPISGNTGIVINTNAGHDIINVGAFTSALPSLTINAGVGDDIVNMNGNITFAANANLDLDLQNDDASPGRDVVNIATGANVALTGTGNATIKVSQNVLVNTGGGLTTANGNLVVEANQQSTPTSGNFVGVRLNGLNALFQVTGSGLLTVKGKGGNTGNDNQGIYLSSSAKILGGTNTVTLEGIGGPTSGYRSYGVSVLENSEVSSTDGNIVMNGTGDGTGFNSGGIGLGYHGVFVRGAIAAGGSGNITITGRGSLNYTEEGSGGVYILSGTVTTAGGNILFNGYGGGSGNARFCAGVVIASSSVSPGGMGTLTLYGEGGPGTGTGNLGVRVSAAITSNGGNITVTGKEGGSNSSHGVFVENTDINGVNGEIKTSINGGDITVTTNSFASVLDNQALITGHPSNKITFLPLTNGTEINFVSTSEVASNPILISDFEFDNVTGGAIHFGNANTGAINVNQAITHAAGNIYLITGQALNLNQSFGAGTGNITINAAGGINPKATTVDLSGNTISFTSGNNLNIAIGGTTVNTEYDELNIQGAIDLTGLNLVLSGSYVPVAGNTFTIVNNDGTDAIVGTFNNLAQGATIPNFRGSGLNATISYTGGSDNNDVVITVASAAVAEINVKGNSQNIVSGDNTPIITDHTDFGAVSVPSGSVTRTFTIENPNTATAALVLGTITGGTTDFVITQPSLTTIPVGSSTTFTVTFDPTVAGKRTATISIPNNDPDENPYTFAIEGYGGTPFVTTWKTDNVGTSNSTSITIPTTGSGYNYDVDWNNDGTFDEFGLTGNVTHNYGTAGTYTVAIRGDFPRIYFNIEGDRRKLVSIQQWGSIVWTSMEKAFWGCENMVLNATDVPNTAAVTDMSFMFANCRSFNQALPVGFNTTAVTDMSYMFSGCTIYNQALPSTFNTAQVTKMNNMFSDCGDYNKALPNSFSTASVTDMSYLFYRCIDYNQTLPSSFNTAAVTNMRSMFEGCSAYNKALPISFNTAAVTNMRGMFDGCVNYNHVLPSSFNTAAVTDMIDMFADCRAYNQVLPLSFNTVSVTNMRGMFDACITYNQALPSSFNTAAVTDMSSMFRNCLDYNQALPSSFNTAAVTDMSAMFSGCSNYNQALPNSFTTAAVTSMSAMFASARAFNQNIGTWSTAAVTNMSEMFAGARAFNQNLGSLNISLVTDMTDMLRNSGLSVDNYDATLIGWNNGGYTNKNLGDASPLKYCAAQSARNTLTTTKGWTITGDISVIPATPTASVTVQPTCTTSTGTIVVTEPVDGDIQYSIGGPYQISGTFSGLNPGPYTVTAKNTTTGCISSGLSLTVNAVPSAPATPTASVTLQPTCTTPKGTIVVTAPVDGDIQYSIGGPYQISGTFSGLDSGPYTVTAKNTTTGCISSGLSLTVNAVPNAPAIPTASVTVQPTCTTSTGTIVVTAPVDGDIQYSIGGPYQISGTFSGLDSGPYTVTAKNTTTGCISSGLSLTVNAVPSAPATPTASVTVQPTCTTPTGTIEVTAPLGTGIEYSIGGLYQTSGTFSGLNPGPYTVTAKNTTTGCISSGLSLTVNAVPNAPAIPTASVTVQPTCTISKGTIVVTAPVDGDIQYSIGGPYQISGTFSGLNPGPYTVTAKNTTTGCISSGLSLTVNAVPSAPATPTASVTVQPTCTTPTGTIVVTAPVDGDIQYSIGGPYQTLGTFSGLNPGPYTVTAKNTTTGCISSGLSLTVNAVPNAPAIPTASVTVQPTCTTPTGTIVVTAPSGTGIEYSIGGLYQTLGTFSGLNPGPYTVTAKNTTTGCISSGLSLTVNTVPNAPAIPTASVTVQPTCTTPTGTIVVTAPVDGDIQYSIGGPYQTSGTFSGLDSGPYTVTAKNTTTGCISSGLLLTVNAVPSALNIATGTSSPICAGVTSFTIPYTVVMGTPTTYSVSGAGITTVSNGVLTNPIVVNLSGPATGNAISYTLTVGNASGCVSGNITGSVTVVGPPTISLTTLQQTLNEGNNPVLCDTDANPVNSLQFNVSGLCVSGNPVWRVQVGNGAWSAWSATAPVFQPSNNQTHRYQAACDASCASTYSGVIELTINNRATVPQNVSLVVDGVTVAVGETREVCSLVTIPLTFNANCAAGEITLYSVDGGEYSSGVPTGLVDNQYHNYRVRCRKSDGTPSCVESESGVMRLKLVTIPSAPTVSLSSTSSCNPSASFSGQSSCGSLRTVWYNATTNVALPSLPSTVPGQTTSYYARCQTENGCVSEKSNVVTFTLTPTQVAPVITASQEIVCTGTTVTISANCPAGSQTFWNTGVTAPSFQVAFNNVTKQTYWAKCLFEGGCQSAESIRKDIYWNAFVVTLINVGETKSAVKPANDKSLWSSQFITRDGGPELEQSTQQNPTLYYVENANKIAPRYWTINVEACGLSTDGSLTFDMLATPEMGVIRSFNTHENNAPYFMYANREGWTELYAQNHPAYGFYQDNGAGGNVYDAGLPKGLYKLGIRYWDMKGWGSIYPSTRQPQGNVLAYQEYWFRIQSKDGVGVGAARTAEGATTLSSRRDLKSTNNVFAQVMPNPVLSVLRLQVADSKGQTVQTTLSDASGREVLRRKFVPETNTHQEEFGVSELPTGMYFLKVMTEMQQATLKVVKVE
ncbi:BspA family leucine-rich repeat surface protein [Runella limosa]|uniref:BspA family leucine-rich repeat surface protein n=1 Tax=Runella limosa TaxID=370978 RepID=UPI000409C383|nr:BspA family leucine-rich repeat surface protein [Runella limosa]